MSACTPAVDTVPVDTVPVEAMSVEALSVETVPVVAVGELEVAAADRHVSRIARGVVEELNTAIGCDQGMSIAVRQNLRPLIDEAALSVHGAPARAADFMLSGKLTQEADGSLRLALELAKRSSPSLAMAMISPLASVPSLVARSLR
jgi:hypothetical protein